MKVGIIEFDKDWFTFCFDPSEHYYESSGNKEDEEEEDSGDDKGIMPQNSEPSIFVFI